MKSLCFQEKKQRYEEQRRKLEKGGNSFLDSIRAEYDEDEEAENR